MNYFYSTIRVESECPHSLEFDFQNKLTQIKQDPNFVSSIISFILEINQRHDIFEADKLHRELGTMDWLFYKVCKHQQKKLAAVTNQEI